MFGERVKNNAVSAAFMYFLAGIVAATGIALVTGVLVSSERSTDSAMITFCGFVTLTISYVMTKLAAIFDNYERLLAAKSLNMLTDRERIAIQTQLDQRRRRDTARYYVPIVVPCAVLLITLAIREVMLFDENTIGVVVEEKGSESGNQIVPPTNGCKCNEATRNAQ